MIKTPSSGAAAVPDDDRLFSLGNASGMTVMVSEHGAALRAWHAPDRYGRMANILRPQADPPLPAAPALAWDGCHRDGGVALQRRAADGAEQRISYRLGDDGSLVVQCQSLAASLAPFKLALDPHFNLNGGSADVGDHMLRIDADYFVELNPDGKPARVAMVGGTAFDFRHPAPIGARLNWPDPQLGIAGGFAHCFFVRGHGAGGLGPLREVASMFDPGSGRRLQVSTTEAGLGFRAGKRGGLGLETNALPGLMNAAWPQLILHPGQTYRHTTVYRVSLQD